MNHYFLIPSVSSQNPNGDRPPLENFDKDFPHKFRAELYQFYNNSLSTKNRDPYRFLGCRGIKQKFWLNAWNNYLKNKTLPAIDRFESNLFEMLRRESSNQDIWILCPFHGIITAEELIPNYMISNDAFLPGCGFLKDYWQSKIKREIKSKSHHAIFWNFLDNNWPNINNTNINKTLITIKFHERNNSDLSIFKLVKLVRENKPQNYSNALKLLNKLGSKFNSDHHVL